MHGNKILPSIYNLSSMVVSRSLLLQSYLFELSLTSIAFFFLGTIPCISQLTFNLTEIGPHNLNRDIIIEGNGANISDQGIQLTPDERQREGRAIYVQQLHLWDTTSKQLADFSTHCSFVIDSSSSRPSYGDGLAFFLAQNNSVITPGGGMGLPIESNTIRATHSFVAVEFDTFWNIIDPRDLTNASVGDHVGINISNLTSVRYEKWWNNVTSGRENEVWINYTSASKNLSVVFTGFQNNTRVLQSGLHYTVDLRDVLPERVIFGFGASTGESFQRNTVKSWSFSSSDLQGKDENKRGLVIGLSIGLCGLVSGLALILFVLWKKRMRQSKEDDGLNEEMDNEFKMGTGPKRFSYNELERATSNFSEKEKLGEGGFGGVYRGFLRESNSYVAVKRISKSSRQGIKEYASEVKIISRLRHRNMVQLIGWCHEKKELLLVYEFMGNGSLDLHLFKGKSLLKWGVRYRIAQGLASALLYLHEEWEQCILHRDIKSSNIMLDANFNAKVGDFGLAKFVDHEKGAQTTVLAGTMGYMAPECYVTGKASKESDVFSFGVVILEIASGRKPIVFYAPDDQVRLVEWVWELYGMGKLLEAADPKLGNEFDEREIEHLMIVGLWCAHPDSNLRPSIKKAIQVLNLEAPPPVLPSKMPVPTYSAPPTSSLLSLAYGADVSSNSQIQMSSSSYNTDSSKFTASSAASLPSASLLYTK